MSFNDIFKSSFLENVSEFSILDTVIGLAVALVIGLFIFIIYKKTLTGVMYSSGFALTLVGLSLVTTLVIMAVTSNVVLSLGMVGALSIVRFRTAIKEPVEIVFLFWSLAVGIVIGAGMIPLAVIGSAIIGVILLLFANRKIHNNPYILVMNCADEKAEKAVLDILGKDTEHYIVKSKTITTAGIELTAELRTKDASTSFVNLIFLLGLALVISAFGQDIGATLNSAMPFLDKATWTVLLITLSGLIGAVTPVGRMAGSTELSNLLLYSVVALLASRASFLELTDAPAWILAGFMILAIHGIILVLLAKIFHLDMFTCGVASLANIGGSASAPILAGAYSGALVPVGVLMALMGYVIGTAGGLITANIMSLLA